MRAKTNKRAIKPRMSEPIMVSANSDRAKLRKPSQIVSRKKPLDLGLSWIFVLGIIGVLFAGYLTFSRMISGSCPLTEPCPFFLGQPACVYGLVMYSIILLASGVALFADLTKSWMAGLRSTILFVSAAGVLFAGYFTIQDWILATCIDGPCVYSLGVPSCVYGLLMYLAVFIISVTSARRG